MTEEERDSELDYRTDLALEAEGEHSMRKETTPELARYQLAQVRLARTQELLRGAAESFIAAGRVLADAQRFEDWHTLGRSSWREYCELDLKISDALAYDLVRIAAFCDTHPDYVARVLDIGISNTRLLLPHLKDADDERIDELLDSAAEQSWRDLRQQLNGDDREREDARGRIEARCPKCNATIWLGRATTIYSRAA